jgi:von Willebrand factor
VECPSGRVYMPCGPQFEKTCGSTVSDNVAACQEGCFCPNNMWLHNGTCIELDRCPCKLRAKEFPPGAKIQRDCNMCSCGNGEWKCSDLNCGARCSAIGDPHYVTFDGKHYSFMGKCSYYLLKTDDLSVEAENVPCHGTISEVSY